MEDLFKKIPELVNYRKAELISGGISNQNYRIISTDPNKSDQLVTLFPNMKIWWKADKEELITNLYKKKNIPSTTILNTGYINHKNHTYRYILREFVKEKDFDIFLRDEKYLSPKDLISLLTQLGNILGTLHSISMSSYGLLIENSISGSDIKKVFPASNWQRYVDRLMMNRKNLSKRLDMKRAYGSITGADIQKIFKSSYTLYKDYRSVLTKVTQPFLIHYDMSLKNIIVNYNIQLDQWEISAIIDNEWVSAGDPDIDLIQIENSVHFSSHKEAFKKYWSFFIEAYAKKKTFSKDIGKKPERNDNNSCEKCGQ